MIELEWGEGSKATIQVVRDEVLARRGCVAALDPGKHGAAVLRHPDRRYEARLIGDARRGDWRDVGDWLARCDVDLLVIETQFAVVAPPGTPIYRVTAQAGAAMHVARNAGLIAGWFGAASRNPAHPPPVVVWVQPSTWQRWALGNMRKREDLKRRSLELAREHIPDILEAISRAPDREGVADARGMLDWALTCPMR